MIAVDPEPKFGTSLSSWRVSRDGMVFARIVETDANRVFRSVLLWGQDPENRPRLHGSLAEAEARFTAWERKTPRRSPPAKLTARMTGRSQRYYDIFANGQKIGTLNQTFRWQLPTGSTDTKLRWVAKVAYGGDTMAVNGRVFTDFDEALLYIRCWVDSRDWWDTLAIC